MYGETGVEEERGEESVVQRNNPMYLCLAINTITRQSSFILAVPGQARRPLRPVVIGPRRVGDFKVTGGSFEKRLESPGPVVQVPSPNGEWSETPGTYFTSSSAPEFLTKLAKAWWTSARILTKYKHPSEFVRAEIRALDWSNRTGPYADYAGTSSAQHGQD